MSRSSPATLHTHAVSSLPLTQNAVPGGHVFQVATQRAAEPDPLHWLFLSPADALGLTLLSPQPPACEDRLAPWPEAHQVGSSTFPVTWPLQPLRQVPLTDVGGADVPAGVVSGGLAWGNGPSGAFRPTPPSTCTT